MDAERNTPPPATLLERLRNIHVGWWFGVAASLILLLSLIFFAHKDHHAGFECGRDAVVGQDLSAKYKSISEAIAAAPEWSSRMHCIFVQSGTYSEQVLIAAAKRNIVLYGESKDTTFITFNLSESSPQEPNATVVVYGENFIAVNITFEIAARKETENAMAFFTRADHSILYKCTLRGNQGTANLYLGKQFLRECDIYGSNNIIHGDATAVLQKSTIYVGESIPSTNNVIISQDRRSPLSASGFIFQNCRFESTSNLMKSPDVFLGSPGGPYSRVIILRSYMGSLINPAGWISQNDEGASTVTYGEFENFGPGASTRNRVSWKGVRILTPSDASMFTVDGFLDGRGWLRPTGVPYNGDSEN